MACEISNPMFHKIDRLFGPHDVDLFATRKNNKRIPASLKILDQPVSVSPMELDPASHQEDQNLPCGFRPTETISPEAVTNPSPPGISRPEKRKAVDERQQELDAHRLAIKRSQYDQKGLNDQARAILSSNYKQQHLETRYAYIQNRFLKQTDFQALILLAICVFMRPSDKERIDESRTTSSLDSVKFTMVEPKEKRMGLSINKTVYISSHSEKRPKASALGSTLATEAGASIDEVVSQGYWSSRSVFD
ncbi:hypothetical protein AX774_g3217 [Zancudomyces culisetae]|uniref:Uncharacterized protein n=1 Tax=Zancudomyces culisetae TaxID=1213189 RepID=A0A1R1PQQ5_ZANCU|nr:hypothetical protein AX774_g3217 [Zancudomyces culisetae]|eukprot:OMH83279.1 hypothetical protein AX774_g3217 [Zancudomyces culisetae]